MKIHRPHIPPAAAAAFFFAMAGYFASLTASIPDPQWLRQHPAIVTATFLFCSAFATYLLMRALTPLRVVTPLEEEYDSFLYHYRSAVAASIRLVGAGDERFPPDRLHVVPTQVPYELPEAFLATKAEVIRSLQKEAALGNKMFYDGPNTRLVAYSSTPIDESEQKHLTLRLGPIGWHDYSVTKFHMNELLEPLINPEADQQRSMSAWERLKRYIDLDRVATDGAISNSSLTNILCVALTVITSDGYVTYSKRSHRVSAEGGKYTSSVAENIHQSKDRSLQPGPESELRAPYRAAIRGIDEELSESVGNVARSHPSQLVLLGLDFDLNSLQPDLLFLFAWPGTLASLKDTIKRKPGHDFGEGRLLDAPLDGRQLEDLLLRPEWLGSGKASVIRSVEFVNSLRVAHRGRSLSDILTSGLWQSPL